MARHGIGRFLIPALALAIGTPAMGQFAPPPPKKPAPLDIPEEGLIKASETAEAKRERRRAAERNWKRLREEAMRAALVERGDDGSVVRLDTLPQIAAIEAHPEARERLLSRTMPEAYAEGEVPLRDLPQSRGLRESTPLEGERLEQIRVAIADHRYQLEETVLAHLELLRELEGELIPDLSPFNQQAMSRVRELVEVIEPDGTLIDALRDQELISSLVRDNLDMMVDGYKQAFNDALLEGAGGAGSGDNSNIEAVTRAFWRQKIAEPIWAHEGMLIDASRHLPELAGALDLDGQTRRRFRELAEALEGADERTRIERVRELVFSLSLPQHRRLLREVRILRER